ncbi:MAG TPA: hypothetical protein VHY91_05345 [Pirellulales bacterium]|jgi:hypothetical protein|nr:hypothetical protein [Pirellulales bacterium]
MLRVVCGQCGKKLEIPDAWAHNVVKCPQCREPIDMQEHDSAECVVKLGQFLNDNLGGSGAPGDKSRPTARPPGPPTPPSPLDIAWRQVHAFVRRHSLIVAIGGVAFLLIVLDTVWIHSGTVTAGALAGGIAAVAAWKSEMRSRLPSSSARSEIEYKVAIGLIALLGLRLAWFCYSEISAIVAADNLADVAPAFALLPKWGAILAVILVAAVPIGAALGSLPLVQRFSIYHVLSAGLVLVSLGYGVIEVVSQQVAGAGISQFVRKQFAPGGGEVKVGWAGKPGGSAPANHANPAAATNGGTGESRVAPGGGQPIETVAQAMVPIVAEPVVVPWTAAADPSSAAPPKIGSRLPAIHFGTQSWNPVEPAVPSAWLAVGDNRLEQSVRQLWDLSRNQRLGELDGLIEFTEPVAVSADEPLIAGYISTGMLVEVWSLAEGQMVGRLACQGIAGGAHPYVAFVGPETLAMVYARGTDPQTPPVCQIWNFAQGEMLTEFVATGAGGGAKTKWALSPGRRYLAAADKSSLHLFDLAEKQMVGEASVPSVPTTSNLDCAGIAFSPDGQEVTAVFHGDKKSHLLAWGMNDGKVMADGEFNMDLARGSPTDCRPIEPLPGGAGWIAFERVIIPPISGQQFRAWTVVQPTATGAGLPRLAKVLDPTRLLVIADDALRVVKLPPLKQRPPNELLTLSQLLSGAPAPEKKTFANQRPMPGAGQSADGGVPDYISRKYTREAYIDFLTADDERVNEQVRWAPWSKRPVFGVRWGLGILPTNVPANLMERQQIEPITGAIGPKLVAALDERLDAGAFGAWPAGEDSRLTRVGWLGVGNRSDLTSSAKRQDFDIIAVVSVNWQKGGQRQITVRVGDVVNGLVVFSSSTLKTGPPAPGSGSKGDSVDKWLSELMHQVDQKMTLQPMPELTAEDAKHAAERLVSAKRHDRAADLVELRTYQARHLIDNASAAAYYEQLLGDGMGETFANGDAEERRQVLEKVLPAE